MNARLILHFRDSAPVFGELRKRRQFALNELCSLSGALEMQYDKGLVPTRCHEMSDDELRDTKITWERSPQPEVMSDRFAMLETEILFDMDRLSATLESQGHTADSDELIGSARSLVRPI